MPATRPTLEQWRLALRLLSALRDEIADPGRFQGLRDKQIVELLDDLLSDAGYDPSTDGQARKIQDGPDAADNPRPARG